MAFVDALTNGSAIALVGVYLNCGSADPLVRLKVEMVQSLRSTAQVFSFSLDSGQRNNNTDLALTKTQKTGRGSRAMLFSHLSTKGSVSRDGGAAPSFQIIGSTHAPIIAPSISVGDNPRAEYQDHGYLVS
jgi:hypothetical protein